MFNLIIRCCIELDFWLVKFVTVSDLEFVLFESVFIVIRRDTYKWLEMSGLNVDILDDPINIFR